MECFHQGGLKGRIKTNMNVIDIGALIVICSFETVLGMKRSLSGLCRYFSCSFP